MPAAHGLRRGFGALKAEGAEGGERRRIVGDAGKDEIARGDAELWRVLEQPRVMPLDPSHVMGEVGGETVKPRIATEFGEAGKRRALEWKALRLLVGDHLQPMFDTTQECISEAQVIHRFRAHPFIGAELLKHVERA